jgi:Ni/Co efflux regulator RcnB
MLMKVAARRVLHVPKLLVGAALCLALIMQQAAAAELSFGSLAHADSGYLLSAGAKAKGNAPGSKGAFVPPGQAKKWAKGQYLPKSVAWTPVPAVLLAKLKPAPPGHQYVVVDGQVLLIALATGLILDALDII